MNKVKIYLANPRGFCAGVDRAISIVERALFLFGNPVYVRHEVVHNKFIVDQLRQMGAIFVEELDIVPDHATVIFSAHGVAPHVHKHALQRPLNIIDATCPLVAKVHMEVKHHAMSGHDVILIGHAGHPEVIGTMGYYYESRINGGYLYLVENVTDVPRLVVNKPNNLFYVTQTTLSVTDTTAIVTELRKKFPLIQGPQNDDICFATQNRQNAVSYLVEHKNCEVILVVGSLNSSNSNRLREVAEKFGVPAWLVDSPTDIQKSWLIGKNIIGVTAGASAPGLLVEQIVTQLQLLINTTTVVIEMESTAEEILAFSLPRKIRC